MDDHGYASRGGLSLALCERRRARQTGHGHCVSFYFSLPLTFWLLLGLLPNFDRTTKKSPRECRANKFKNSTAGPAPPDGSPDAKPVCRCLWTQGGR